MKGPRERFTRGITACDLRPEGDAGGREEKNGEQKGQPLDRSERSAAGGTRVLRARFQAPLPEGTRGTWHPRRIAAEEQSRAPAERIEDIIQKTPLFLCLAWAAVTAGCSTDATSRGAAPVQVAALATQGVVHDGDASPPGDATGAARSPERSGGFAFPAGFPGLLAHDASQIATAPLGWNRSDWTKFGIGIAAVGGALLIDEELRRSIERNSNGTTRSVADAVRPFGEEYSWGVLGGFYLAGTVFHDDRAKAVAEDSLASSLIAAGVITPLLKATVGRNRPQETQSLFTRSEDGRSFPSGHTTQAFAIASVIASHYESPWIQTAAYTLAGLVGWSRMEHNAHFASDVLAGALIGTVVGRTVVRLHETERLHITAAPSVNPASPGVALTFQTNLGDFLRLFRRD
jgi:membrane-associated phospholipid phosphatase